MAVGSQKFRHTKAHPWSKSSCWCLWLPWSFLLDDYQGPYDSVIYLLPICSFAESLPGGDHLLHLWLCIRNVSYFSQDSPVSFCWVFVGSRVDDTNFSWFQLLSCLSWILEASALTYSCLFVLCCLSGVSLYLLIAIYFLLNLYLIKSLIKNGESGKRIGLVIMSIFCCSF